VLLFNLTKPDFSLLIGGTDIEYCYLRRLPLATAG
jgi:hypothetical protein